MRNRKKIFSFKSPFSSETANKTFLIWSNLLLILLFAPRKSVKLSDCCHLGRCKATWLQDLASWSLHFIVVMIIISFCFVYYLKKKNLVYLCCKSLMTDHHLKFCLQVFNPKMSIEKKVMLKIYFSTLHKSFLTQNLCRKFSSSI